MQIREHIPLAPFTTFGVGGPARYFCEAASEDDIRAAVDYARGNSLPLFVLGGGSNLVVSDAGWPGLVLKINLGGISEAFASPTLAIFRAGAGVDWDALVAHAVSKNCAGIECLSGIPGTVGGTPIQNVGAYGQEVSQTLVSVRAIEISSGMVFEFTNAECGFGYRSSIFNGPQRGKFIVTEVRFGLKPGGEPKIAYADLKRHFEGQSSPRLAEVRDAVREIRRSKAMLIVPGDPDCRSAGSFFKNPIVSKEEFSAIESTAKAKGLTIPNYPATDGTVKLAAAWLVEQSGFRKGFADGTVGISSKHTLALVNRGGATAADILRLKNHVQDVVQKAWGIELHPEPVIVGEILRA
jgi:UDP-N-acetylmuramate dehydrogenase